MKADYRDAPPRAQSHDCLRQAFTQGVQLVVDGDAQRLKDARCRMDAFPLSGALQDSRNKGGELRSRVRQAAPLAPRDDHASDAPGRTLFSERKEDLGQLPFARRRQHVVGAGSAGGIHPHVEDRGLSEREAALRIVKLHRRDSEIEENAVQRRDFAPVEDPTELAKVGVHEGQTGVGKLLRHRTRARVGVQCDQPSVPQPLQDRRCMPARPEGSVDVNSAGANRQVFEHRPHEHGNVAQHSDTTS